MSSISVSRSLRYIQALEGRVRGRGDGGLSPKIGDRVQQFEKADLRHKVSNWNDSICCLKLSYVEIATHIGQLSMSFKRSCLARGGGTAAAVPPPFRLGNPALCGRRPLVTPYYCRLCVLCLYLLLCFFCTSLHMSIQYQSPI